MRADHLMMVLLAAAPAVYAWWSGRSLRRSIDDPALPDLLLARQQRVMQVTLVVIIAGALLPTPTGFGIAIVLAVMAAQYPIRRGLYGDTWSLWQYLRFTTFSAIAFVGLWLFPLIASLIVVQIARAWIPEPSTSQIALGFVLGVVAAVVYLVWHHYFVPVWLSLHQATPIDARTSGSLLARFDAVLDRAGSRLAGRPTVHRYGAEGGQVINAAALCSLRTRAVAMSDALLAGLDEEESTAIFAHEIAHHEHFDTAVLRKRRRWAYGLALLMTFIPPLQLASGGRYAILIDTAFLAAILLLFARGQRGHREHETACDLRAVDLTGDADTVIRALTKIHALSRMPRRFTQEFERAATHPSLARRIQAIRAHATLEATPLAAPTVVATTTPGAYVALDDARSHWFEGVPDDTPLDVAALRDRATCYRALAHGELAELRLDAAKPRMLRATDVGGRSWSVGIRDEDVHLVLTALDTVDTRFGKAPVASLPTSEHTARTLAAALLLATMLGGLWGMPMLVAAISAFVPSAASMAAMAVLTIGQVALALGAGQLGDSDAALALGATYEALAIAAAALLAVGSGWIAWRWIRKRRDESSSGSRKWSRAAIAVLVLGVLTSSLGLAEDGAPSLAGLVGNAGTARVAVALLGLAAALLALRSRAWRRVGIGAALLGVVGLVNGAVGQRFASPSSTIAWTTGRLSLVATVPVGHAVHEVELSPAGTRFLTRRYADDESAEDGDYSVQLVTGTIPLSGPTRTLKAVDAALPSESELLVLDRVEGDSLELRLERPDADSASRVVWRRGLPAMAGPNLHLRARGARWLVSGQRIGEHHRTFVTVDGATSGSDVHVTEVPGDTLYGQTLYTFGDGTTLVATVKPLQGAGSVPRSVFRAYLAAMWGNGIRWTISRYDREGVRAVATARGYPSCAGTPDGELAVCVDQWRRATRVLSITRTGGLVDLGRLSERYERASATPSGHIVASSIRGRSVAVVDVARRRGIRASLPDGEYDYLRELTATDSGIVAVLSGPQGMRIGVYRLDSAPDAPAMVAR
jgi:Zn-dependent protease with chaperone function